MQTTTRKDSNNALAPVRSIKTAIRHHRPHWMRFADEKRGWASIKFTLGDYNTGLHLSIDAHESYEHDSGRDSTKRVMLQLDEDAARQLYAILHERFNGQ